MLTILPLHLPRYELLSNLVYAAQAAFLSDCSMTCSPTLGDSVIGVIRSFEGDAEGTPSPYSLWRARTIARNFF